MVQNTIQSLSRIDSIDKTSIMKEEALIGISDSCNKILAKYNV